MTEEHVPDLVSRAVEALPAEHRPKDLEALLCGYLSHLLQRNLEINLVSRKDTVAHVERFTRECLFLARILYEEREHRPAPEKPPKLLDIGSGGGFPGLVLKIAMPDLDIVLVEATRKKARFLADVAAGLDLRQTKILGGRTEDLLQVEGVSGVRVLGHRFDWVTCKALGTIQNSAALAEPFLAPHGVHWTFKGSACRVEIQAAGGFFRQRGLSPHRVERIPGSAESYVVGVQRLSVPGAGRSKSAGPR
jgi:16S rRNA (guanine527-N7)-methyltransferase